MPHDSSPRPGRSKAAISDGDNGAMQPIGTQHQNISRKHLMIFDIHVHEEAASERAAQNVARLGLSDFVLRQESQAHMLVGDGVVARKRCDIAPPDQDSSANRRRGQPPRDRDAARKPPAWWPCRRHGYRLPRQPQKHEHSRSAPAIASKMAGLLPAWLHGNPREDSPWQPWKRPRLAGARPRHRPARITSRASAPARASQDKIANIILIAFAHTADVGDLRELYFQHG